MVGPNYQALLAIFCFFIFSTILSLFLGYSIGKMEMQLFYLTNTQTKPQILETPIEIRFKQRREILKKFCAEHRNSTKRDRPSIEEQPFAAFEFFTYKEANVFFCSPPKTASTLLDNFLITKFLAPEDRQNREIVHEKRRFQFQSFENIQKVKALKFMVTREPLDRLLSCWYDKFSGLMEENLVSETFSPIIIGRTRLNESSSEHSIATPIPIPAYDPAKQMPTLEEFFKYLAYDHNNGNLECPDNSYYCGLHYNHWYQQLIEVLIFYLFFFLFFQRAPIANQCYPCDIDYDYIIETSTFDAELQYVMAKANPDVPWSELKTDSIPISYRNVAKYDSMKIKSQLLANLPPSLVMKALQNYSNDYNMFGYNKSNSYTDHVFRSQI